MVCIYQLYNIQLNTDVHSKLCSKMATGINTSVEIFSPYRTMFHVKPFPKDLPITIARHQDTNKNLPSELSEVNHSVLGIYGK